MNNKLSREELEKRIAELERQVEQFKHDSDKYRTLLDTFPLGITITDQQAEENREQLLKELEREKQIQNALIKVSRDILEVSDFSSAARRVFDAAREITGARSGYVALLSPGGEENELLFLESGGLSCSVDPSLPMPVRGLRSEAYKTGCVAFDNDFMNSRWAAFMPAGHVDLKNVLFAPLNIRGKTVGIMGLANKAEDFTEEDRSAAKAFGQLAAMALQNSQAMTALRGSEEKFRRLYMSMAEGMALHQLLYDAAGKAVNYVLLDVNPAYEAITGLKADQVWGRKATSVYGTAEAPYLDVYANVVATGQPEKIEVWFAPMGKLFRITAFSPAGDQFATLFEDITERRRIEVELQNSEEKFFRAFMSNASLMAISTIEDGRYIDVNDKFLEVVGLERDEIVGKTSSELHFFADSGQRDRIIELLSEKGSVHNLEIDFKTRSGEIRQGLFSGDMIHLNYIEDCWLTVLHDITERRQAEEKIRKALKEKEILLAEVHHRVKNNLQIVSSLINLQINDLSDAFTIKLLKETRSRVQAMAYIHEVLYESDSMSKIDMNAYLEKIVGAVSKSTGYGYAAVALTVSAEGISLNLKQAIPVGLIVNELLTNAYKHAFPDRLDTCAINITLREQADHIIQAVVSDNGAGIPESFDWRQASTLGLELAVLLTEQQLDGTIALDRGQGTTFTITFTKDVSDE